MSATLTPLLSAAAFVMVMILVAWALIRKRNVLYAGFSKNDGMRQIIEIGGGMRIAVVDIDGHRVACAIGKNGISAMQILGDTDRATGT